jgi:translation initiation factor IF-1
VATEGGNAQAVRLDAVPLSAHIPNSIKSRIHAGDYVLINKRQWQTDGTDVDVVYHYDAQQVKQLLEFGHIV